MVSENDTPKSVAARNRICSHGPIDSVQARNRAETHRREYRPRKMNVPTNHFRRDLPPAPRIEAQGSFFVPANVPVERAVLGAIIDSELILSASIDAGLGEHDFSLSDHQRIFSAILSLRRTRVPVNYLTVAEELGNSQHDTALIGDLITGVVLVPSHVAHLVEIVREKSLLRKFAQLGDWLSTAACQVGARPCTLHKELLQRLSSGYEV
jgi:hypothetical protein